MWINRIALSSLIIMTAAWLAWAGPSFQITDLGAGVTAYAINRNGVIGGISADGQAILINHGSVTNLGIAGGAEALTNATSPIVVGDGPFRWTASSGTHLLAVPEGALWSSARAVNSSGVIVGYSNTDTEQLAVCWVNQQPQTLASNAAALTINDLGVAGGYVGADAILWNPNGSVTNLGTFGTTSAMVVALNNRAQALIEVYTGGNPSLMRWLAGKITVLGLLPNSTGCVGAGMNVGGWAIGYCDMVDANGSYAGTMPALWTQTTAQNLQALAVNGTGWVLEYPFGINDLGQIVGAGTYNGAWHGFLLTPTVSPPSLALSDTERFPR